MAFIYNCLQCPEGPMTRAEAKAHLHNEGHEVEEEWDTDIHEEEAADLAYEQHRYQGGED